MRDMTPTDLQSAAFEDGVEFEQKRSELLLKFVTLFTTWAHNDKYKHGQNDLPCVTCQAVAVIKQYEEFTDE